MSHVDEGRLHAFLDGELGGEEEQALQDHLADCLECSTLFEETAEAHAGASALLAAADSAGSAPEWADLVARAAAGEAAPPQPSFLRPALAWAATLVLAFFLGWQANRSDDLAIRSMPAPRERPAELRAEPEADERLDATAGETTDAPVGADFLDLADDATENELQEAPPAEAEARAPAAAAPQEDVTNVEEESRSAEAARRRQESAEQAVAAAPPPAREANEPPQTVAEPAPASAGFRALSRMEAVPEAEGALGISAPRADDGFASIAAGDAASWLGVEPLRLPLADLRDVAVGPPTAFDGGSPGAPVLRFTYDLSGRDQRLVVWQQRLEPDALALDALDDAADADRPARDVIAEAPASLRSDGLGMLEWTDPRGYRVRVAARLPIVELRELASRLRLDR